MDDDTRYVDVLICDSGRFYGQTLTYEVPRIWIGQWRRFWAIGAHLAVPVGARTLHGVVVSHEGAYRGPGMRIPVRAMEEREFKALGLVVPAFDRVPEDFNI